uniref:Putative secreted peptide n=1 Tax=Anopheles braziliensis TaxID=58242 RepID=A0A2M3ZWC7_9DIPT
MPRSCDWGFLSNAAVLAIALRAFANVVFPESTCPRMPTFRFRYILPVCKHRQRAVCDKNTNPKQSRFRFYALHLVGA